jgi:hypothetical protein
VAILIAKINVNRPYEIAKFNADIAYTTLPNFFNGIFVLLDVVQFKGQRINREFNDV